MSLFRKNTKNSFYCVLHKISSNPYQLKTINYSERMKYVSKNVNKLNDTKVFWIIVHQHDHNIKFMIIIFNQSCSFAQNAISTENQQCNPDLFRKSFFEHGFPTIALYFCHNGGKPRFFPVQIAFCHRTCALFSVNIKSRDYIFIYIKWYN